MSIKIENEYDMNEIKSKIVNRTIITGEFPGVGKSFMLKQICKKEETVYVCPYNRLCYEIKVQARESITANILFALDQNGNRMKEVAEYDITGFKNVIFEEIYCLDLKILRKIEYLIRKHPDKQFYANGDSKQLRGINMGQIEHQYIVDKVIVSIFPNNINLKQIKRQSKLEQQEKIKKIKVQIWSDDFKEGKITIKDIFRELKEVELKDIEGKCLTLTNETAQQVNQINNTKRGGIKKGDEVLCKCSVLFKDKERKAVGEKGRLYTNYSYTIKKITKTGYVLEELLHKYTFDITSKEFSNWFRLGYAQTVCSVQGLTFNEPFTICDLNHFHCRTNQEFLWVAITRCEDLDMISVCYNTSTLKLKNIDEKIRGHKEADRKAGRTFDDVYEKGKDGVIKYIDEKKFVNEKWVQNQIFRQQYMCVFCHNLLSLDYSSDSSEQFSIDRIDNSIGHSQGNCLVSCWACNRSKK